MASMSQYTSVFRVQLKDYRGARNGNGNNYTSSNSSPDARDLDQQARQSRRRTMTRARYRPVVSCQLCRVRKLKCDRLLPCGSCTRRGEEALCQYTGNNRGEGVRGDATSRQPDEAYSTGVPSTSGGMTDEAQERLDRLEALVNGMVAQSDVRGAPRGHLERSSEADDVDNRDPVLAVESPSGPNWTAVLNSIRDIRSYLGGTTATDNGNDGYHSENSENDGNMDLGSASQVRLLEMAEPDIIFATAAPRPGLAMASSGLAARQMALAAQDEAIAMLPPREECKQLLSTYFQEAYLTNAFVHGGQFQRQCARFWAMGARPSAVCGASPFLWLSALASTLCHASMLNGMQQQTSWLGSSGIPAATDDASLHERVVRLRTLSTRWLLAGDYLSARPLAVEALLLNASTRLLQRRDADPALWGAFAMATRLAQRMGYQQVDSPSAGTGRSMLTPFEKEMRRRTWYIVEAYDMIYSFQFGMASIIHEDDTATDLPHNLYDSDFDETCAVLPPSRPPSDVSPALYYARKLCHIRLLRRIIQFTKTGRSGATTHASLAAELYQVHCDLPAGLRMPCYIRDCPASDASYQIMHRLVLELLYNKAVCVLFRHTLSSERVTSEQNEKHGTSQERQERQHQRHVCLVSALRILDLHVDFEAETRLTNADSSGTGSGRLATERHMFGTLALNDFILAATILCLDLIEVKKDVQIPPTSTLDMEYASYPTPTDRSLEQRAVSRAEKLLALREAYSLWHSRRLTSRDAAHAARVLGTIVRKLSEEGGNEDPVTTRMTQNDMDTDTDSAALHPSLAPPVNITYDWAEPDPFDAVLSDPYNLDWYAIDSFLLDRQPNTDAGGMLWSAELMAGGR